MQIEILTKSEIKLFNSPLSMNYKQKEYYFDISKGLLKKLKERYKVENIAIFILLFGHFKISNRFYNIVDYSHDDLEYILKKYSLIKYSNDISERTIRFYKKIIKDNMSIADYTQEIKDILTKEANSLSKNFIHRKKIFYYLINFSKILKIEIPSNTQLTKIISKALNAQKKDIFTKLEPLLKNIKLKELDEFLQKELNTNNRYKLFYYKRLEHSTTRKQMLLSLTKFNTIKSKFNLLQEIIHKIGLKPKIAQYYAKWIEKSQIFQVKRKKDTQLYFLLLSFVYHQYLIRNDNLIDRFISIIQSAKNSSFRAQKDFSFALDPYKNKMMQSLEKTNIATLNDIENIIKNTSLNDSSKVIEIEKLVQTKTKLLQSILDDKKLFETLLENKYGFIEKKSVSLQGKLSDILKVIEFDEISSNKNIITAINYFKSVATINNKAPKAFLNDEEITIIYTSDKFKVSLYKVLLFFHVSDAIKNGTLHLKHSIKYRNFEDYIIDKSEWKKNRKVLLKTHDLEHLEKYDTFIKNINNKLENSFQQSNENISKGFNSYFTTTNNSFILKTPKLEKSEDDESIAKYFPLKQYISIIDLLHAIDIEVDFLSSFEHYNQNKTKINNNLLLATLLGYGCNLSLSKIAKISKGINENQLDNIKTWYISEENIKEANDKIITFMDNLEIVKTMRNDEDINHTSSDGQKYNISQSVDSTNAGYSFKYFGTDKGVVAYTFIDESHRLFHSQVINVNERESGYVIDGLLHNGVVKSDIHSTDTHGFTEVIFGITNLLGFSFAPRIKNFKKQQLYGFNKPKFYHNLGYELSPKRKINEKVISDNWDDMLRLIVTIKERKTTATQILKRLTSYSRQHKLYTAFKEFGKIIKTDFLLNYIDDVSLRQRIEKQLNKVESSNKFSKAVFFGNNSEFTVATEQEQNIANNSKRLIQNSIILWNYMFITKKLHQAPNKKEKYEIILALKNSSIVRWGFINLYGEYDFTHYSKQIHRLIALGDTKNI